MTFIIDRNAPQRGQCTNPGLPPTRQMVWVKTRQMEAWTCSACAWAFNPSGPPLGNSLEEMMLNYELQRDEEYADHRCAENPRTESTQDDSKIPRRVEARRYSSNPGSLVICNERRRAI